MRARLERIQADRCLAKITFEAESEDPDTYRIEVVYEIHRPSDTDFTLDVDPHFIERLSCTRTDTREPVTLDPETEKRVKQAAIAKVAASNSWGTG